MSQNLLKVGKIGNLKPKRPNVKLDYARNYKSDQIEI